MRFVFVLPALMLATSCAAVPAAPAPAIRYEHASNADCTANPHLARARELYDQLMFDRAATALQRAIERPHNCRAELAEIYRLKAFIDAING